MLVSDGQPAAPGYYGTAAEEDLRGIQQEYRRKGVLFLAAAIGDDKENIQRIYGGRLSGHLRLAQAARKAGPGGQTLLGRISHTLPILGQQLFDRVGSAGAPPILSQFVTANFGYPFLGNTRQRGPNWLYFK